MNNKKVTIPKLMEWKKINKKSVALTAYDFTFARFIDEAEIDIVLVGDSLGMVSLGYENTLPVTMDEMIHHTKAVKRALSKALLVGDMPFMSYQVSVEEAIRNAGRFIQEGGAEAVKIEGGVRVLPQVRSVVDAGISVMGHVGLTPQSVHQFGGYKVQGKDILDGKKIKKDAMELQKAGVFAIVLEGIPMELAEEITKSLVIPTIGIGAGPHCDGQILVTQDLLGMNKDFIPKFVKHYAQLGDTIESALNQYASEVQNGQFPENKHSYFLPKKKLKKVSQEKR